jgi:hypothetical protein
MIRTTAPLIQDSMRREQPRANDASRSSRSAWRTLARTGGLEPPPPGFVVRHIVHFCYVRRLERPTGFEPAFPSLRGWCPALDDDRELAPAGGFEPPSFSVNSRARSPRVLDRNKLVETVGDAPTATILQGSSAPLCCPRGAEGWFRANLPALSTRCFHQISFLGELERPVGNRTHRPHVGNVVLCH